MHIWKLLRYFSPLTGITVAASAIILLAPSPANASLIVSFGNTTAAVAGSDQVIDVLLQDSGAAVTVDAFSFEFTTLNPFITFTGANTSTTAAAYIFAGNSLFGPIISTTPPPTGQMVIATDLAVCCGTVVGANSTFALGEVRFHVAAGATSGTASLVFDSIGTSLSDGSGNGIPIATLTNGVVTITGASVPEPSTLPIFAALALLVVTAAQIRRRKLTRRGPEPLREGYKSTLA
jgi:hypothetical protein